jgi:hypothetical protein
MNILLIAGLGGLVLVVANALVSVGVARASSYSPAQKTVQCAIVWLIPIIGVVLVWGVLRSQSGAFNATTGFEPQQDQDIDGREFRHPDVS